MQDETAVIETFINVYHHLTDSGVFIFDVHTVYKMMTLFNNQSYIDDKGTFLAWDAVQGDLPLSVYHDMTFFIRHEDETYSRFDESHFQRTFDEKTYLSWLAQVGFKHVETFTDFNIDEHNEDAERLFSLRKIKVKPLAQTCIKLRSGFMYQFYYAIKIFNSMEVIYYKCCCFNYGISWFYILEQDDYTSRDFENKDTALKQSTSENSSLSKLEDVQAKDGDNSKIKVLYMSI